MFGRWLDEPCVYHRLTNPINSRRALLGTLLRTENGSSHRFTVSRLWRWNEMLGFLPSTGASVEICTTMPPQYVAFIPLVHKTKILLVLHSHSLRLDMLSKTPEFWLSSPDVPLERRKAQSKVVRNKLQCLWNIRPEQTDTHFLR